MTTERHPFEPFLPGNARVLFLGSFPPQPKRWSMDFYYPNWINDFWRICGLVFFGEKGHFEVAGEKRFGFTSDNYIGAGFQKNTPKDSFIEFFAECRLRVQFERASEYFDTSEIKAINAFLDRLDKYLIEPDHPSLLHGDLWGGNYITGPDGEAWLIDPAAYVGHFEADLAMTELFGGFRDEFYRAYFEVSPCQPGYEDRRDIYNLYHLLNHLNLFGAGYLSSVKGIVRRYV